MNLVKLVQTSRAIGVKPSNEALTCVVYPVAMTWAVLIVHIKILIIIQIDGKDAAIAIPQVLPL